MKVKRLLKNCVTIATFLPLPKCIDITLSCANEVEDPSRELDTVCVPVPSGKESFSNVHLALNDPIFITRLSVVQ